MDKQATGQAFREAEVRGGRSTPAGQESGLPPTRAARPARSRGIFFGGRLAGIARWVAGAVCVAVAAISIAATAPRVLDAPGAFLHPGPALFAAT